MAEIDHDEVMEFFAELRRNSEKDWEESDSSYSGQSGNTDNAADKPDIGAEEKRTAETTNGTGADDNRKPEKSEKLKMEVYDWVQCFVTALVCCMLIFIFAGRTIGVEGSSMMDTLHDTDRVVMYNLFFKPKRGDIIVFQSHNEERFHDVPLVKRVIATAGDIIDIDFDTGEVMVNGATVYEPYIYTVTTVSEGFKGPVIIPEGFVFVMGDNRNHSIDSRNSDVGLVDTRYILGRVFFLLVPGTESNFSRDWSRFGFVS